LHKGFKLSFHFVENPFFTNTEVWKEYHTEESSPYTGEIDTTEIKVCEIEWKPGKNVTVEKVQKKTKGGGAKKAKQKAKEKEEPRDSFFRGFFRHLKPDMPIPDDVNLDEARNLCDDSEEEDEDMLGLLMENDYEIGCAVRDQLVPFAVRWYTGEAAPEEEDDDDYDDDEDLGDDDDEDDEEDDEDDDSDEDDDDEDDVKGKGGGKPAKKRTGSGDKKGGPAPKAAPGGAAPGGKTEECKQQ
jgi:nucleosome assembly protein 1-like 1